MPKKLTLSDDEIALIRRHREERVHYVKGWNDAIEAALAEVDPANGKLTYNELVSFIANLRKAL